MTRCWFWYLYDVGVGVGDFALAVAIIAALSSGWKHAVSMLQSCRTVMIILSWWRSLELQFAWWVEATLASIPAPAPLWEAAISTLALCSEVVVCTAGRVVVALPE